MPDSNPILVTPDNFVRAESDLYFANIVKAENAFARFSHNREPASVAAVSSSRTCAHASRSGCRAPRSRCARSCRTPAMT